MNDKQQLAAMGAQYRLTEEQAKGLAERMPKTGALQVIDDEPLCTEIRINGVEACGADIGGLLDRCLPHTTEQKPLCMAKRIEELEAQVRVVARLLDECIGDEEGSVQFFGIDLMNRISAALAGKLPTPVVPDATVALSDIASLQRYTLGGHCDDFGQDCGAEMEQDDEGEYILLAEALMLAASTSPDTTK